MGKELAASVKGSDRAGHELRTLEALLTVDQTVKAQATEAKAQRASAAGKCTARVKGSGLEFEGLTYSVLKKQKKEGKWIRREVDLLHGVTGYASKGYVTAVMGPSGAGKSTFLDALAGRIAKGSLRGSMTVDGQAVNPSLMKRMSAYVMQDDRLYPMLTVWETLLFAAEVRLPQSLPHAEKRERVTKLIDQLGLTSAQNTYIGNEGVRGVSGGEKRRVSIGVDIIHGPALLFLDEPTSGLDSTSAYSVIEKVHAIAISGSTVLLTIHQPSYRIQQLLDHLIILARGKLIYQGSPTYLTTHLAEFGREVPRGENSVEYLLDVIQEYDSSTLGLDPLVNFNKDGVKPSQSPMLMPKSSALNSKGKSPLPVYKSPKMHSFGASPKSGLRATGEDDSLSIMEASSGKFNYNSDSDSDDYDHSITRDVPKLASLYYMGILSFADKFPTPRVTTTATAARLALDNSHHKNQSGVGSPSVNSLTEEIHPATPISRPSIADDKVADGEISGRSLGPKFVNSWLREVGVLSLRNFKNIQRTPELFFSRQLVLTVMGIMMATLFKNPPNDLEGVTQWLSFFIFTVCLFFFSSNDAVPNFIQERFIFIRETSHNAYRSSSYVLAGVITYLPFFAIQAATYAVITFWALKLHGGAEAFLFFWLTLYISLIETNSFVMFVSALVPNYILGYAAVIAFTALYFLTCGYFLKRSAIPAYWKWLHYLSSIKYPYEALMINHFDSDGCYAEVAGVCALDGRELLKDLDITELTKWESLYILIGWAVFYRALFYFVLRFASKNQRT